jgi:fatty-acyl-CoA synthase
VIDALYTHHATLWNRWYSNAEAHPDQDAIVHWLAGRQPTRWTFSSLISAAERTAANLVDLDIRRGDVCAIIMRHQEYLYPLYLGIDCVGAIPAVLAYPNPRLHPEKFREGLLGMSRRSGLDWIMTERDLEPVIAPLIADQETTIKGVYFPLEWKTGRSLEGESLRRAIAIHASMDRDDPLLLQHSSGTTGLQKPVLLSHRAVLEHVDHYGKAINLCQEDKIVSWLPLYHDMGLIAAFHLPLAFGIPSIQIDPFEWVRIPSLLLEVVSKERGTISWLPNFAFNMIAEKTTEHDLQGISLESWRLVVNCSEPVRFESHRKFLQRLEPYGLSPLSMSSCYAMAETTFAVTQNPPGTKVEVLSVDRRALSQGRVKIVESHPDARMCVSSGLTIPGCNVRIVDDSSTIVSDGVVGEVAIKSISLFDGYRNYPDKTAEVMRDGWYYSGDFGFKHGENYYIIGRKKDTIIVAGNNIYPEDIEDIVSRVAGIIPGRVVAFGEDDEGLGSEAVSVVAETPIVELGEQKKLRMEVVRAGMAIDVSISTVYLVPPRWLIKSSAGKPSRKANKERIMTGKGSSGLQSLGAGCGDRQR